MVENDTICANSSSFTLISNSIGTINWYADTINNNIINTGNSFNTPILNSTTSYYLTQEAANSSGGPVDNNIGSGGYYNNDRHLFIDCYSPSTIVSMDVYAGSANTITFELRDNNSTVIDDTTITVVTGLNTLYVDFDMPIGNDFELGIGAAGSNLYRNSTGAAYPYNIGNLASITGHNSPNSATYHYFFYNLQLQENCKSEYSEIVAVLNPPLSTPTISQNGNQLSTTNNPLYSYQWYLNGNAINGANSPTINIIQAGDYIVEIHYNGCDISSANFSVVTGINEQIHNILVHPNPLKDICEISSDLLIESIAILDVSGKLLYEFSEVNTFKYSIDLSKLSTGIYFTKVISANATTEHKLIIQK